jgi:hypothetical protein
VTAQYRARSQSASRRELIAGTLATSLESPHAGEMMAQLVQSGKHRLGGEGN